MERAGKRPDTAALQKEELAAALKNREFCVCYQPQVEMDTGNIVGAEALVRWKRPGSGLLLPGSFIPELEQNGLMPLLDVEVLRIVCADIREAGEAGVCLGPVSVNLSRLYAGRYEGHRTCALCLDDMGVRQQAESSALLFELTETAEGGEGEHAIREFAGQLRENGFQIAMDDYGMGRSTLKMLHQIPFDILKLDRYFVSCIGGERAEKILKSTISMAGELGLKVVAEGVETEEQAAFLLENGCRLAQGYYYSGPLDRDAYIRYRREGRTGAAS